MPVPPHPRAVFLGGPAVAYDEWYHDEAHMANDVRALAGATPHALLGSRFVQDVRSRGA